MPSALPRQRKTTQMVVKLAPSEKAAIERRAAELGLDPTSLLRSGWRYFPMPKTARP